MFSRKCTRIKEHGSFGQSLVETALFLPLIIFLIAGVLELSNLLLTQNRVSSAARSGTRFAAANFGEDQWAAWESTYAREVANVAQNNVTETLDLDPARWDIWAIKATIAVDGSGNRSFSEWRPVHITDTVEFSVMPLADWNARVPALQQEILDALETVPNGTEIVATDAYHDRNAFLGLAPYNLGPFTRIRGLTVMRVDETGGTYGSCDTFPIAMSLDNYSLWPTDQPGTIPAGHERFPQAADWGNAMGHGANYWAGKPGDKPLYTTSDTSQFPRNVPGRHVTDAQVGDIFLTKQTDAENRPGYFGWLRWNQTSSATAEPPLRGSLAWPGNSHTYYYPPWSDDGRINVFDLLKPWLGNGNSNGVTYHMEQHVEQGVNGRLLRLIVFTPPDWVEQPGYTPGDANNDTHGTIFSGGQPGIYEVYAFVLARIVGYNFTGDEPWLLMEFHGWDVDCAPAPAYP
ncbi:MAG: pilus assembly protein [Chloroflexi bacterium]|jgi:hypothetical protein|nr:pilus assembly protein [Chloroflexota bacterium]